MNKQKLLVLAVSLVACLSGLNSGNAQTVTLLDTMNNNTTPTSWINVSNTQIIGQLFQTTASAFTISELQLGLFNMNGATGTLQLSFYSAVPNTSNPGYYLPSSLVDARTYDVSLVPGYSGMTPSNPFIVTGLNVVLAPSQNYFLIAQGASFNNFDFGFGESYPGDIAWLFNQNATGILEGGRNGGWAASAKISAVPEPSALSLVVIGIGALAFVRRRRN
jgi:hypothetical protein